MKKLHPLLLIICFLCAGCAMPLADLLPFTSNSGGGQEDIKALTMVQLTTGNYRILKTNVVGTDWGISLLGFIPVVSPDYTKAISKLYKAGELTEGNPQAIVNVLQQHTSPYFILFSIPRITFRADVVEFTKTTPALTP